MSRRTQNPWLHEDRIRTIGWALELHVEKFGYFETLDEFLSWAGCIVGVSSAAVRNSLKARGYWFNSSLGLTKETRVRLLQETIIMSGKKY